MSLLRRETQDGVSASLPPSAPLPSSGPRPSLRGGPGQRGAQTALQALWVGIIPALLAALVLRRFVPPIASGAAGVIATVANRYWLPFAIGLFFVFSVMARYWRFRLPGGRYASRLPAHLLPDERDPALLAEAASAAGLHEVFVSSRMRRRIERALDSSTRTAIDRHLFALREALERGDSEAIREATAVLESLAALPLSSARRREALGVLGAALVAAAAALGLRAVVEPYRVLSGSMLPTLEPDDIVVANRHAYRSLRGGGAEGGQRLPRRGDLILFRSDAVLVDRVGGPEVLVKRVIGLPGDRISMAGDVPLINGWMVPFCDAGRYLYVSGEGEPVRGKVRVEFLEGRAYLTVQSLWTAFEGTYVVRPGEVFVLGDSRSNSADSRAWNGGKGAGVPLDAVVGRAQWFLLGRLRSGDLDVGRAFKTLDALSGTPHVEGAEGQQLGEGIAKCLKTPPAATHPPEPPREAQAAQANGNPGK